VIPFVEVGVTVIDAAGLRLWRHVHPCSAA
jgi:hypothetical protein